MNEFVIDVKTFTKMFVAISYLREQRMFNFYDISNYITDQYCYDDTADFSLHDLQVEFEDVIKSMVDDKTISDIGDLGYGLYFINNTINYKEIIDDNRDSLAEMTKIFFDIYGGYETQVYIVPSKTKRI